MRLLATLALAALLVSGCKKSPSEGAAPLKVAAAADLAFAFKDVGDAYEKKTGQKVTFSFGSTGLLAKQISEGAPFDVFAAANVSFADDVIGAGACAPDSKSLYARGRIVLFAAKNGPLKPTKLADVADAKVVKIAIANPDHAPYGRAAKEALTKAGLWDKVQPKMVYGENIQQTLQYAKSGNAELAVVALSLATVTEGDWVEIDSTLHEPIDQALVVCGASKGPDGRGRAFTAFVASDEGRAIMKRYGFLLPNEALPAAKK